MGELEPAVPLSRKHARDLKDQRREFRYFVIRMAREYLETSNILGRNGGLMEKSMQLVQPFNMIPLFARESLALFAYVNAMPTPAELLVWTRPIADSAVVAHALWEGLAWQDLNLEMSESTACDSRKR